MQSSRPNDTCIYLVVTRNMYMDEIRKHYEGIMAVAERTTVLRIEETRLGRKLVSRFTILFFFINAT